MEIEELKQQIILMINDRENYTPMGFGDFCTLLAPDSPGDVEKALRELLEAGKIVKTKRGKYASASDCGYFSCTYRATTKGYGFASFDSREKNDIFIPREKSMGAINGDIVQVKLTGMGESPEGEVVRILRRNLTEVVGLFREVREVSGGYGNRGRGGKEKRKFSRLSVNRSYVVRPDDPKLTFKISIPLGAKGNAMEGDKVLVRLSSYPKMNERSGKTENAVGKIVKIFGKNDSLAANYRSILWEHGISTEFTSAAVSEAEKISEEPIIPDGRVDLRKEIIFTIDGPDAKDFDDAISVKKFDGRFELGVHIADVSHYVREGSALDFEAMERGTSVYFVDRVVPMLPEEFSNGICSLNRDTDKYTLSAFISLDEKGNILSVELKKAIISSKLRGVYPEVNDVIEKGEKSVYWDKYSFLFPDTLPVMLDLYRILEEKSARRGSLGMETAEPIIILDDNGYPQNILPRKRGVAEKLIEQFMLAANEAVAGWLDMMGYPCVYRVHEPPTEEKIRNFAVFSQNLGLDISGLKRKNPHPSAYRKIYSEAEEKGLSGVLNPVMLRSLMKAKYSSAKAPHFGLACDDYCHFTSPIRRYPDLAVHRIVSAVLAGETNVGHYDIFAEEAAESSSRNELRATGAERDIEDLYKTVYMSDKVGEEFDAVISSVTGFGIFAELENTCEGLIPISSLDGYYEFNEATLSLVGPDKKYSIGDRVRVVVVGCDIPGRRIEMSIADQ